VGILKALPRFQITETFLQGTFGAVNEAQMLSSILQDVMLRKACGNLIHLNPQIKTWAFSVITVSIPAPIVLVKLLRH
jgi:hypothetical protein